jgi:transaldolase
MVDGVTTNPSLVARSGRNFIQLIEEICEVVAGPVSAEVAATTADEMLKEGLRLSKIGPQVTVKLPLTWDGLKVCKTLSERGIMVNITLCFSAAQAILAAKAGATFVSPFVGRLDDLSEDGMRLIADICAIYKQYDGFKTQVLVASVRSPLHVVNAARLGADVATIPPSLLRQLVKHPLTDMGLDSFLSDWQKTGQSIN